MQFGIREICDVVLKAKATTKLGKKTFYKGEPVLYFDTLKTSSLEQQATTVYAQGGAGNSRLISWDGEKTVTFTMEDALLSKESFAILAAAEIVDRDNLEVRFTERTTSVVKDNDVVYITLKTAPIFTGSRGEVKGHVMIIYDEDEYSEPYKSWIINPVDAPSALQPAALRGMLIGIAAEDGYTPDLSKFTNGCSVLFDGYEEVEDGEAVQINITPEILGGNYYLEGTTLFKGTNGADIPAHFIIPNCKIQSNFTFTMASTGDPSTFTFTMDAMPDYLAFDKTKKRFAAIQIEMSDQEEEEERDRTDHKWPIAIAEDINYEKNRIKFVTSVPVALEPFTKAPYAILKVKGLFERKIKHYFTANWGPSYRNSNIQLYSQIENGKQIWVWQEPFVSDPWLETRIYITDPDLVDRIQIGDTIEFDIYTEPVDYTNTIETVCVDKEIELAWNEEDEYYSALIDLPQDIAHHLNKTVRFADYRSLYPHCFKLIYEGKETVFEGGYYEGQDFDIAIGEENDVWKIFFSVLGPKLTETINKFITVSELAPSIDTKEIYRGVTYFNYEDYPEDRIGVIVHSVKDEEFKDGKHYDICIDDDGIPVIETIYDKTNDRFTSIEPNLLLIEPLDEPIQELDVEYIVKYSGDPSTFFGMPHISGLSMTAGIPSLIKILKKD